MATGLGTDRGPIQLDHFHRPAEIIHSVHDGYQPGYPIDLRDLSIRARAASGPYGDFEAKAARVVARATGLRTVIQDDNRIPRTPDLRLEAGSQVIGVGEVVTTSVGARAQQLRAFSTGEFEFESNELSGTWWVAVTSAAKRKDLRALLTKVFSEVEARGDHVQLNGLPSLRDPIPEIALLEDLGLTEVVCDPAPRSGPGKVYGHPTGIGGPVAIDWAGCAAWIDGFLKGDLCMRKWAKLMSRVNLAERHLYVGITGDDPWPVHRVLETDLLEVALPAPALPEGITHLWLDNAEFPSRCLAWWPDREWFDVRTRWARD